MRDLHHLTGIDREDLFGEADWCAQRGLLHPCDDRHTPALMREPDESIRAQRIGEIYRAKRDAGALIGRPITTHLQGFP
jgi:hypothetical protein